jgi:hypothetical protein
MKRFVLACMVALIAAAPAPVPKYSPVPQNGQTTAVNTYLRNMQNGAFPAAFAMLNDEARAYYRNAANFRSVFDADGYRIQKFNLLGSRGNAAGRVYFARETASFHDHARDIDATVTATVPVGVISVKGGYRIKDPGHPWRAFAPNTTLKTNGVSVVVKKVSFFSNRIEVIATFANAGDEFVTLLPYRRSVLRDDLGGVYRIIELKNWQITDKALFLGLRLAPSAQYTGFLNFEAPKLDDRARSFTLTVAPALREGGDEPFTLEIPGIQRAKG